MSVVSQALHQSSSSHCQPDEQMRGIFDAMDQSFDELSQCRHALHEHPQVAYEEEFASDLIAKKLDEWHIEYERGWAATGIVATITGQANSSRKTIGLRADFDALEVEEKTSLPYASRSQGKMHACGHDGHTATLLAAAKYLSETRNFDGTVKLIFQPAEEVADSGAAKMIEEGLLQSHPMDAIYGVHNWPSLQVGKVAMRTGGMLASVDRFDVTIRGRGGHGAMPHLTVDPVIVATYIVSQIQSIISRELSPSSPAVISVTNINGGTGAYSVIPEYVKFSGTIRALDQKTREYVIRRIEEICNLIASSHSATATCYFAGENDPTVNDARCVAFCSAVASEVVGDHNVITDYDPCMGGEDFGVFLKHIPGAFVFLGQATSDPQSPHNRSLHNDRYDFNDELIKIGGAYFSRLVERSMPLASAAE